MYIYIYVCMYVYIYIYVYVCVAISKAKCKGPSRRYHCIFRKLLFDWGSSPQPQLHRAAKPKTKLARNAPPAIVITPCKEPCGGPARKCLVSPVCFMNASTALNKYTSKYKMIVEAHPPNK